MARIRALSAPANTGYARTLGMCLSEARPTVLMIFLLRFATGAALEAKLVAGGDLVRTCAATLVWVTAVFSIYLFNGAMDVREDRVNGSRRPIARGDLAPETALAVSLIAGAAALLGGLVLRGITSWLVAMLLLLGYLYSGPPFSLKRWSSTTVAIGMAGGLLSYWAGFSAPAVPNAQAAVLPVLALASSLWMALIGTLAKDLPDIQGDRAADRRSAAAALGERRTRHALSAAALALPAMFCAVSFALDLPLTATALTMLSGGLGVAILCLTTASKGNRVKRRRPYRVFMATQYAIHIVALLTTGILPN